MINHQNYGPSAACNPFNLPFYDSVFAQNILFQSDYSYAYDIYCFLSGIKKYYPAFDKWFFTKVVPNLATDKRRIITKKLGDEIIGIAILKDTSEKKLSTLKVSEKYRGRGFTSKGLFEECFSILQTEKPFCTVPEDMLPLFKSIFKYYGFKLTSVHSDLYRKGIDELFFNEN